MKLTILAILAILTSASMSSYADHHGKDYKHVLRHLKERKDRKTSKATKPNGSMENHTTELAAAEKGRKHHDKKKPDSKATKVGPDGNSSSTLAEPTTMAQPSTISMQSSLLAPTSLAPTLLAPATMPPAMPAPSIEVEVEAMRAADVIPACPPGYDITKTDYVGGDLVTMTDNIFECHSLYVVFCNIGEWDDALLDQDANAMEMWSDAWVHVGPCSVSEAGVQEPTSSSPTFSPGAVVPEPSSLPTFSPTLTPTLSPTFSPTLSPTIPPTLAPPVGGGSVQAPGAIPACPPAYNVTKTDYVGGDIVTVDENIFECHSLYVVFCNIGEWNDNLLLQDENAEEMWDDAWVLVGSCV